MTLRIKDYPLVDKTTNFMFFAKQTLGAPAMATVATLKLTCEINLRNCAALFSRGLPPRLPFRIIIDDTDDGASHFGCADTEIYVGFNKSLRAKTSPEKMSEIYRLLLIAEVVEVFEAMTSSWNCAYSPGEGLSRVLAFELHPQGEFGPTAGKWLDLNPRPNWVDEMDPEDTQDPSVGCSVLFLNWLRHVKGYGWSEIISADRSTLAEVYQRLTGLGDAWGVFSADMAARWEVGKPSGVRTDQPF